MPRRSYRSRARNYVRRRADKGFSITNAALGIRAVALLGGFDAVDSILNGNIRGAGEAIANKTTLTTVIDAGTPFLVMWGVRKVIGSPKIWGPIRL